uniref:TGF-beta family profile domain-containing protein n=5 Tax=Strigidae TaxID=30459 RepID=A0A8C8AM83_9STRI
MLDLYHAVAGEEEAEEEEEEAAVSRPVLTGLSTQSPPPGSVVSRADTVVSLVNMVEQDRDIFSPKPYWKEFRFDLTQVPTGESVTAAEFRIYKARGVTRHANNTLHVSIYEIAAEHSNRESDLFLLDVQDLRAGTEGWLVFDVTAASNHWLVDRKYNLGLRLYVETDDGHSVDPGSAGLLGRRGPRSKQPFMVTFFRASPGPTRVTRAAKPPRRRQPKKTNDLPHPNKLPGIFDDVHAADGRQVCRRHELYVSFQDLGWLDWVIAPQGYSAYYCEGECAFPLDSCMNATNHAILQSLVHLMKPEAVPKACCAPTKLSATSVLYYDSNNNVILKKHRNMVVKSCGCH